MNKILRYLLILSVVFLVSNKLFMLYLHWEYPKEEIESIFKSITNEYAIKIEYKIGDDFFSPLENPIISAGPAKGSIVKPIRHRVLIRYPELLKKAFSKYPVQVVRKHLKSIQFAGKIDDHGFNTGGTYDPFRRILYLVDDGSQDEKRSIYTIHHEFSSLLLLSRSFFVNPWTDHNPETFNYLYKGTYDALEIYKNTSLVGTSDDYEKGFMNTYGQTDFENDFNEYSAMILTHPNKFKKIMGQYPRVRGKFIVWLEFYQKIDPIFTEAYLFGNS